MYLPQLLHADPAEVDEMYYPRPGATAATAAAQGDWVSKRGSSKLEGYHSHLHAMLSGNNYSPEMADVLLLFGNCRWNMKRAIQNGGMDNYGCFDLWQIEKINGNMSRLGKPLPFPNWSMLKLPANHLEKFGCSYVPPELDMLSAQSEERAAATAAAKAAAAAAAAEAAADVAAASAIPASAVVATSGSPNMLRQVPMQPCASAGTNGGCCCSMQL